ncbi:PAAR domain-containing protein [Burkholderia lata]|uniref:PAAR domain-containing protein n=1 Tax=Burkholderia lata (strain ATCC 17760 / DSM 23089 / LMG 22485 / NCIMB 9086 / R18194 / 383) TaxID=482957 RepID=UPI0015844554|nr:PAAR domain-containing protein [Burkholderia lata]
MNMRTNINGKSQIVVGDLTTHGGVVISGSPFHTWNDIPIVRVGDIVTCPKCSPHIFKVAQGVASFTDNELPVATEDHLTTCGAKLIARAAPASLVIAHTAFASGSGYDEQFILHDLDGNAIPDMPYKITTADGVVIRGITDINGRTDRVISAETLGISVEPDMDHVLTSHSED